MICPKCGSENVTVTMVQTAGKTKMKGTGCLQKLGRAFLILITCGLWLIFGQRAGTGKTKFENEKQALCQACGYSWKI